MKPADIKNKTPNELTNALKEYKTKLARFSFELEARTLKNTSQVKKTKKEIARILTALKND